jgi:hypothetical protein
LTHTSPFDLALAIAASEGAPADSGAEEALLAGGAAVGSRALSAAGTAGPEVVSGFVAGTRLAAGAVAAAGASTGTDAGAGAVSVFALLREDFVVVAGTAVEAAVASAEAVLSFDFLDFVAEPASATEEPVDDEPASSVVFFFFEVFVDEEVSLEAPVDVSAELAALFFFDDFDVEAPGDVAVLSEEEVSDFLDFFFLVELVDD